jgi:hypothetical protein
VSRGTEKIIVRAIIAAITIIVSGTSAAITAFSLCHNCHIPATDYKDDEDYRQANIQYIL